MDAGEMGMRGHGNVCRAEIDGTAFCMSVHSQHHSLHHSLYFTIQPPQQSVSLSQDKSTTGFFIVSIRAAIT